MIANAEPANTGPINPSPASLQQQQQQDRGVVWQCFDEPHTLLAINGGLPKGMQDLVRNAVAEMRRYYSRKVVDVLIRVTRQSVDAMRKRFNIEKGDNLALVGRY